MLWFCSVGEGGLGSDGGLMPMSASNVGLLCGSLEFEVWDADIVGGSFVG